MPPDRGSLDPDALESDEFDAVDEPGARVDGLAVGEGLAVGRFALALSTGEGDSASFAAVAGVSPVLPEFPGGVVGRLLAGAVANPGDMTVAESITARTALTKALAQEVRMMTSLRPGIWRSTSASVRVGDRRRARYCRMIRLAAWSHAIFAPTNGAQAG